MTLRQAKHLVQQGALEKARELCALLAEKEPDNAELAVLRFQIADTEQNWAAAVEHIRHYLTLDPGSANGWLGLGLKLEQLKKYGEAIDAYREVARLQPANAVPYLYLCSNFARLGKTKQAEEAALLCYRLNPGLLWRGDEAGGSDIDRRAALAMEILDRKLSAICDSAISGVGSEYPNADLSRVRQAQWTKTARQPGPFPHDLQRPTSLFIPGLRSQPVFARDDFPWIDGLEAQAIAIQREVKQDLLQTGDVKPYAHHTGDADQAWHQLMQSGLWGSVHFYDGGVRNEDAFQRFPVTAAAIKDLPHVDQNGAPLEVFLSVLKPGAHIPPHFGLTNAGVTVHLPLLVPEGDIAIRVAGCDHRWTEGTCFLFDDTYLHEAWNRMAEPRIVLIFEVWHPDLSPAERAAINACHMARRSWMDSVTTDTVI